MAAALPVRQSGAPGDWHLAGSRPEDYSASIDATVVRDGQPAAAPAVAAPGTPQKRSDRMRLLEVYHLDTWVLACSLRAHGPEHLWLPFPARKGLGPRWPVFVVEALAGRPGPQPRAG
jgi:hypothetical protein